MRRICTICARGGSQGVKNKNIREIAGKPLLAHSIDQAVRSDMFLAVAVSSDSPEICETARQWGATHVIDRPSDLASHTAPKIPAIRHCTTGVEALTGKPFDIVVDLDATAPLRNIDDIKGAIAELENGVWNNVVTGTPARRSPYFNMVETMPDGRVVLSKPPETPIPRRQDAPECFDLNASVFCWRRSALNEKGDFVLTENTGLFVMPEHRSIDIDTELDFRIVTHLMTRGDLLLDA